jgi:hypothetical protein
VDAGHLLNRGPKMPALLRGMKQEVPVGTEVCSV